MIASLQNNMPDYAQWAKGDSSFVAAESNRAGISHSQSTEVVLYTQEGDKVTLSAASQFEAEYATYEGLAGNGRMAAWEKGESFQMSAGMQFSMMVEGNLNAREQADIGKALKNIDKIMEDLISGDFDKVMKRSQQLGRLDSLQSISADLHVRQELYYQHQEAAVVAGGPQASDSGWPAAQLPPGEPGARETAAVDSMADVVKKHAPRSGGLIARLNNYFSELQDRLAAEDANSPKLSVIDRVRSRLLDRIERMNTDENSGHWPRARGMLADD